MSDTESSRGELDLSPGDIVEVSENDWIAAGPAVFIARSIGSYSLTLGLPCRHRDLDFSPTVACMYIPNICNMRVLIKSPDHETIKAFCILNFGYRATDKLITRVLEGDVTLHGRYFPHDF